MTRDQITKAACKLNAADFMNLMEHNGVNTEILDQDNIMDPNDGYFNVILDQDNIMDPNDGYFNVIVEGLDLGEALLFVDGEYCG